MEVALKSLRLFGFRLLTVGSLLLITVITARWLGPAGRGVYALVLLYSSVGVTFLGGMGAALAYQISNQRKPAREVVTTAFTLALGIGGLALMLCLLLYWLIGNLDLWWIVVIGASQPPLLAGAALTYAFLGDDDHHNYNRAIIAPSALSLLLLLALLGTAHLRGGGSARLALLGWLLAQCLTVGWLLWLGRRRWLPPDFEAVTPAAAAGLLSFGAQSGLADLISFFNYKVDVFLLQLFRGVSEVGVYTVAVNSAEGLWFVSSAIGVAIYARVGQLSRQDAAELTAKGMRHAIFIIALMAAALLLVSGVALPLLFGARYNASVNAFRLLVPGIMIFGLGRIFSTFFTNALGRPRIPLLIAATSLGVSLPLCLLLIPPLGMNGAAIATSVSYTVAMILAIILFSRETGIAPRRMLLLDAEDRRAYWQVGRRLRTLLARPAGPVARGER